MQTLALDECRKGFSEWVRPHEQKAARDKAAHDSAWIRSKGAVTRKDKCADWPYRVKEQYESARRSIRVFRWHHRPRVAPDTADRLFYEQATRWKNETMHWSSVTKMIAHPSYLRIIGLGRDFKRGEIEKLILRELKDEPDHWFDALVAITGEDPVRPEDDFDGAVNAWLDWGRQKGILVN
jgi:hypothetical protein